MKKSKLPKTPWANTIRRESGLVEHICEHGCGHPAVASVHWMEIQGHTHMSVHGCDGCCRTPEWQLADALEGMRIANKLLLAARRQR